MNEEDEDVDVDVDMGVDQKAEVKTDEESGAGTKRDWRRKEWNNAEVRARPGTSCLMNRRQKE